MPPPPLPDFPLLTGAGLLPSPPPRDPPPDGGPRDPRTGNAIWPPTTSSRADLFRQRLKLARAHMASRRPAALSFLAESALAREQTRYAALHASRTAARQQAVAARRAAAIAAAGDPFARHDTPAVLPAGIFVRPPHPPSVAALTGLPVDAWRYGAVCMRHPLVLDARTGAAVPVFAREVRASFGWAAEEEESGMSLLRRWDPAGRRARTERFDEARFARAVVEAGVLGRRDRRASCLRCRVEGLPCSFERTARNADKRECGACARNRCAYCLRIVGDREAGRAEDDVGPEPRFRYVRVRKARGWRKVDVVVYVRDEAEMDVEAVGRYAEELLDGEGVSLWGTTLDANDRGAMVLPSWKEAYANTLARKERLDKEFVDDWRGYQEIREETGEGRDASWKDYFDLLASEWTSAHPYMPREPQRRLLLAHPKKEEFIKVWYWYFIHNPEPILRPNRDWMEDLVAPALAWEHWVALKAEARRCR